LEYNTIPYLHLPYKGIIMEKINIRKALDETSDEVFDSIGEDIFNQVWHQAYNQVWDQITDQVFNPIKYQFIQTSIELQRHYYDKTNI